MKVIKVECCKDCPWSRWLRKRGGADLWQCALPGEQGEEWIDIDDPHTIPDWCALWDAAEQETTIEKLGAELRDSESKCADAEFDLFQEKMMRRKLEAKIAELDLELAGMSEGYTQRGYEVESLREEVEELKEKWFDNVQRANAANNLARELAQSLDGLLENYTDFWVTWDCVALSAKEVLDKARETGLL